MTPLIEEFIKNLNTGDIWLGFLVLAVFYVLKKEPFKVFTHFSEQKNKDIEQARILLESERLTKESNKLLREHIETYAFKKYYGIHANREMRIALLNFHQKYQNDIGWYDLKRAFPYINLNGSKVAITLTWQNHLGRFLVTGLSWFIGLYSGLIMVLAFLARNESPTQFTLLTFLSLILLGAAMFFSSINLPYHSANKIKNTLNKGLRKQKR